MSIVFTGADGEQIEQTVTAILKTFIVGKLAADPYLTRLAAWGGAEVAQTNKDFVRFASAAKPFVFIRPGDGSHKRDLFRKNVDDVVYIGRQHTMMFMLELCVTERCQEAILPLRDAIGNMIDVGYEELEGLGLLKTSVNATTSNVNGVQLFNPHLFSCISFTLPIPD